MKERSLPTFLEEGAVDFPAAELLSSAWARLASRAIARPIAIPKGVRLFMVGGATLGGSGKTPLAIALSRALSERGEEVALVGHGYGAKPGHARKVSPADDVRLVGDEALLAARHLEGTGAVVVVGDRRESAVEMAAGLAKTLVLDGPLQAKPRRAYLSLLAVDAKSPWGSGLHPPRGDLRAPLSALLSASDVVVSIGDAPSEALAPLRKPLLFVRSSLASGGRGSEGVEALSTLKTGLLVGFARPIRLLGALDKLGLHPAPILRFRDHRLPSPRFLDEAARLGREARLDAWLATEKCATRLPERIGAVPVVVLEQRLEFSANELDFIESHSGGRPDLP